MPTKFPAAPSCRNQNSAAICSSRRIEGAWMAIGQVGLRLGADYTLTLINEGTDGFVIFGALQLIPTAAATATPR